MHLLSAYEMAINIMERLININPRAQALMLCLKTELLLYAL